MWSNFFMHEEDRRRRAHGARKARMTPEHEGKIKLALLLTSVGATLAVLAVGTEFWVELNTYRDNGSAVCDAAHLGLWKMCTKRLWQADVPAGRDTCGPAELPGGERPPPPRRACIPCLRNPCLSPEKRALAPSECAPTHINLCSGDSLCPRHKLCREGVCTPKLACTPRPVCSSRSASAPRAACSPKPVCAPRPACTSRPAGALKLSYDLQSSYAPSTACEPRHFCVPRPASTPSKPMFLEKPCASAHSLCPRTQPMTPDTAGALRQPLSPRNARAPETACTLRERLWVPGASLLSPHWRQPAPPSCGPWGERPP